MTGRVRSLYPGISPALVGHGPSGCGAGEGFRCAQRFAGIQIAASLSMEPFQVSRWRLRRTRHIWILNAVLVLSYHLTAGRLSCLGRDLRSTEMILLRIPAAKQ